MDWSIRHISEDLDDKDEFSLNCRTCDEDAYRSWEWDQETIQKFHEAHLAAVNQLREFPDDENRFNYYIDTMREFGFERYLGRQEFVPFGYKPPPPPLVFQQPVAEALDDMDEFQPGILTFGNAGGEWDILQALRTEAAHQFGDVKKFRIKINKVIPSGNINIIGQPDGSGEVQVIYHVIQNLKWIPSTINVPYVSHDSINNWVWKLGHEVYKETETAAEDDLDDEINESLDDKDEFAQEEFWYRRFGDLLDEGGPQLLATAIEQHFQPFRVIEINTTNNTIQLTGYSGWGDKPDKELARRSFILRYNPDQNVIGWMRNDLIPKLNNIDNILKTKGLENHPLLFETLEDIDEFDDQFHGWFKTFQQMQDEGGPGAVQQTIEWHSPVNVLEVGDNYVILSTTIDRQNRKVKVPFNPGQTFQSWYNENYSQAAKRQREIGYLEKSKHPLFFEDQELGPTGRPLSPFGNELMKPSGWQARVEPVSTKQYGSPELGLDDVDEFTTNYDDFIVTITNKNHPGKELVGRTGWNRDAGFPLVYEVTRDDFKMSEDLAKKFLFAVYWFAEETEEGRGRAEPFDVDIYDLIHLQSGGATEVINYYNDPEYYTQQAKQTRLTGWDRVGTRTQNESRESTVNIQGHPFTRIDEVDLMNLQMGSWYWFPPNAPEILHNSADEVMEFFEDIYIWFGPEINVRNYYEQSELPTQEGPGLDDFDEFEEIDDPEVELQKWEDADTLAARAAREQMLKEAEKLIPGTGFQLMFVGSKHKTMHGLHATHPLDHIQIPYIIIGRPLVTEALDDKDEFTEHVFIPVSTTILYNAAEVGRPVADVVEIAKMIIVEYGYLPGDFVFKKRDDKGGETRLFGTLEVNDQLVNWLEDEGGFLELTASHSGVLAKYGEIIIILESEGAWLRHQGIDA